MKIRRIFGVIISMLICVSALGACGGIENRDETLYIRYYSGGAGPEWIERLSARFTRDTGIKVYLEKDNRMTENAATLLESNRDLPDLMFVLYTNWRNYVQRGWLEPMDSVYDGTFDDYGVTSLYDGKTLEEILVPEFADYGYMGVTPAAAQQNYYVMPWTAPTTGLVYNVNMLKEVGWQNPPATEAELKQLCADLKAAGKTPFAWGGYGMEMGYWDFPVLTWWAQYSGVEKWQEFYNFESVDVFADEGRVQALRLFQDLIIDENGDWKNSISQPVGRDHMDAQRQFVMGNAAMIPTGSWIENEIREFIPAGFEMKMMPLPVIEGAVDTNVNNTEAGDFACIPKNAVNKEYAKAFLAYMNRMDNVKEFTKLTGMPRPLQYVPSEIAGITEFQKSCFTLYENSKNMWRYSDSPLFTYVGISEWQSFGKQTVYGKLAKPEHLTPKQANDQMHANVKAQWNNWRISVGLAPQSL